MPHLDDGTIHAWLDGALSPDESAGAESHIAECAECAAAVAEGRGLIAASSRILTALDDVPGEVVPSAEGVARRRPRLWATHYARIAAAIAVVGLGVVVVRESRDLAVVAPRAAERALALDSMAAGSTEAVMPAPPAAAPEAAPPPARDEAGADPARGAPAAPSATGRGAIAGAGAAQPAADKPVADAMAVAPKEEHEKRDTAASARQEYAAPPPAAPRTMITPRRTPAPMRMRGVEADSRAQLAQITGRVTDSTGAPIPAAAVTVVGTTSGDLTREDGSFQIANVPTGTQTVEAKRIGYAAAREQVNANAGDTISVNLALSAQALRLNPAVVPDAATADTTEDREIAGLTLLNTSESVVDGRPVRRSLYQLRPGVTLALVERRARVDQSGAPATTSPQGLSLPRRQAADERRRLEEQRRAAKDAPAQINTISWTSTDGTEFTLTGAVAVVELEEVRRKIEQP